MDDQDNLDQIRQLWEEQYAAPFPASCRAKDRDGIDYVVLDSDFASFLSGYMLTGSPSIGAVAKLGVLYHDVRQVLASTHGEGYHYFHRWETLAGLILQRIWKQEVQNDEVRLAQEREAWREANKVPSRWGDAVCQGCDGLKRTWGDSEKWICSRCGLPLGPYQDAVPEG